MLPFAPVVRLALVLLVSFEFYLVLKSVNGVSRKLKGCLKFLGCFNKFQEFFKVVSKVFQESFSRMFQEHFKGVSSKIEGHFKR